MIVLLPLQKQHCHVEHQWQPSESKIGWPYYHQTVPLPGNLSASLMSVHAHDPQAPRVSTHKEEKWNDGIKEEYFLNLADSAEFASWLAPLAEVDKGVTVILGYLDLVYQFLELNHSETRSYPSTVTLHVDSRS